MSRKYCCSPLQEVEQVPYWDSLLLYNRDGEKLHGQAMHQSRTFADDT